MLTFAFAVKEALVNPTTVAVNVVLVVLVLGAVAVLVVVVVAAGVVELVPFPGLGVVVAEDTIATTQRRVSARSGTGIFWFESADPAPAYL